MSIARVALALACVLACHREPASEPASEVFLDADLGTLCARVEARTISAWSQPAFRSRELGALAYRVDLGDAAARCELGALMKSRRVHGCRAVAGDLRRDCT